MQAFLDFAESVRPAVDETLDRLLPSASAPPVRLHEAMRYSVFAGGKRVRPTLVLLTAETIGLPRPIALPGAAALEMIHTYSLIHDDLPALDDDDLRRGKPTCHRRFDEATAILAGDALLTEALTVLAREPRTASEAARRQAVVAVGTAVGSGGMIGGQADDLAAERNWPDDAEELLRSIHRRKTGALLCSCLEIAGIYAEIDEAHMALLRQLGERIGLMFQIADDILDIEGTSDVLGKTAGKDEAAQKLTYPGLLGLEESRARLQRARHEATDLAERLAPGDALLPSLFRFLTERDR